MSRLSLPRAVQMRETLQYKKFCRRHIRRGRPLWRFQKRAFSIFLVLPNLR